MKHWFVVILAAIMIQGCIGLAGKGAVKYGEHLAGNMTGAVESGEVSGAKIKAAWPGISVMIREVLAENYTMEMNTIALGRMTRLDELSAQKDVNDMAVLGAMLRLDAEIGKGLWDRYGISILGLLRGL